MTKDEAKMLLQECNRIDLLLKVLDFGIIPSRAGIFKAQDALQNIQNYITNHKPDGRKSKPKTP